MIVDFDSRVARFVAAFNKWIPDASRPADVTENIAANIVLQIDHYRRPTLAAIDVLAERRRQIESEGWTPEHDDAHDPGEIAGAAAAYALNAAGLLHPYNGAPIDDPPDCWMWDRKWWKPAMESDDARRDLVKAGALILAGIERIDREAAKAKAGT